MGLFLVDSSIRAHRKEAILKAEGSAGQGVAGVGAREVDMRKLKSLIEQGQLSDHDALFYKEKESK